MAVARTSLNTRLRARPDESGVLGHARHRSKQSLIRRFYKPANVHTDNRVVTVLASDHIRLDLAEMSAPNQSWLNFFEFLQAPFEFDPIPRLRR